MKKTITILGVVALILIITAGITLAADDGPIFKRNISRTPNTMTGASQMSSMWLYVPAQNTQGECADSNNDGTCGIDYLAGDCTNQDPTGCDLVYTRTETKPLFVTYNDGMIEEVLPESMGGGQTGAGFGERDAYAALRMDDGDTWKNWNLYD